ncbi:MAG: sigma 54-interacting transcriptional regulator, partial [Kofleriaceae bacterium]
LFEQADGGTLFLDELGELPIDLQPKLLRALEQREVRRVGSTKASKVDVRIIAATNRNLEDEVKAGRFRQDLFYRLSVVRLHLPSLAQRVDDIPLLLQHFLDTGSYNRRPNAAQKVRAVSAEALAALQNYPWPGNVRELVNVIERAVSFCDNEQLELSDLPDYVRNAKAATSPVRAQTATTGGHRRPTTHGTGANPVVPMSASLPTPTPPDELLAEGVTFKDAKERWVASFERDYILQLLRRNSGNISHAARAADIDRKYFRKLMKKYDIEAAGIDDEPEPVES